MRYFVRTTLAWNVLAFVGDTLIGPLISIAGIAPDFSVIAIVILAMSEGAGAGVLGGFMLGLVQDLSHPNLLGLHALCKTLLGYSVGRMRGHLVYGLPLVEGLVVFTAVLLHDTLFLLVQSRLSDEAFLGPFFRQILPVAFYSSLVGVPMIRLADLLGILRQEE